MLRRTEDLQNDLLTSFFVGDWMLTSSSSSSSMYFFIRPFYFPNLFTFIVYLVQLTRFILYTKHYIHSSWSIEEIYLLACKLIMWCMYSKSPLERTSIVDGSQNLVRSIEVVSHIVCNLCRIPKNVRIKESCPLIRAIRLRKFSL